MLLILLMIFTVIMTFIDKAARGTLTIESFFVGFVWAILMFYLCFKEEMDLLFWIPLVIALIILWVFYGAVAIGYVLFLLIVRWAYRKFVGKG